MALHYELPVYKACYDLLLGYSWNWTNQRLKSIEVDTVATLSRNFTAWNERCASSA
jgi:hypothetical protein